MRTRRTLRTVALSAATIVAAAALAGGCVDEDRPRGEARRTGTIEMPLVGTGPSGTTYRLTSASFGVTGMTTTTFSGNGDVVRRELVVGEYSILLRNGWVMNQVASDGTMQPVDAALKGPNPIPFTIAELETTVVSFEFMIGVENVRLGNGALRVVINPNDGLIDNFEDANHLVLPIGGRNGSWFTFNDGTALQLPEPGTLPAPQLLGQNGGYALRTHGAGFTAWGAGLGATLKVAVDGSVQPYDASRFTGIRFKYRSSEDVRFEIETPATAPPPAGICMGVCFDGHGVTLPASRPWRTVEIDWTELRQQGFGDPALFSPSRILQLKWVFRPVDFDLTLDDVELVIARPPVDDPARMGSWAPIIPFPSIPIHAHLLPDRRMLFWGTGHVAPWIFDPRNGSFLATPVPDQEPFCSGHSFLADGRLLVTGGQVHGTGNDNGLATAFAYDPGANTWTRLADMNAGRWYPTNVALAEGDVLVVSGSITPGVNNEEPQVYHPATNSWRNLPGARRSWALYPMMHLAPDGLVLHTGPESEAFFVDVSGSGAILGGPARSPAMNGSGNSILYAEGKVLVVGGGDPPRATAEVIDLTAPAPAWRPVAPMAHPRVLQNAVILADGKVLVTGGTSGAGFNNRIGAVREAELWEPETETWQELAPQSVPRLYHSVSVLLADGRVLSGGGGSPPASNGGTDNLDAEVFSPPYLFRGARPVIQGAPDQAAWDQTITVQTTHAAHIARVNLIRLTSVTHSTNMEQRLARPSFTATADALDVHVPANPHLLPAGHYLLFIVDHTGVPSEGRVIRIGS